MEERIICAVCECEVKMSDMYLAHDVAESEDVGLCEKCYYEETFYCDYHDRSELSSAYQHTTGNGGTICSEAYAEFFQTCDRCGEIYEECYIYYVDELDELQCSGCHEEYLESRVIKDYHDNEDDYQDNMRDTARDRVYGNKLYFGMELEVESGYHNADVNLMAQELYNMNDDFVYEHDGSLQNGFEIISYPFTFRYMKNKMAQELYNMLDILKRGDYVTSERCGLHFHISREGIRSEVDLVCLVEHFKDELFELSKRSRVKFDQWSRFYTNDNDFTRTDIRYLLDDCMSRYRAVNDDNYHTMEIRIFSGTLNFYEIMARFELVYNMVQWVNDNRINEEVDNIPSFMEVATYMSNEFIGEYLNVFYGKEVMC